MSESFQPNEMSVRQFRDLGYLLEVNRRFLHPLGLALSVVMDNATGECSWGAIWDYRDDPEGIAYDEFDPQDRAHKTYVDTEIQERAKARIKALGYWVQPVPDE